MNVATILFTGTSIPYHVLDYAIDWARENEGSLHALFIVDSQPEEGLYAFPNDLDAAEELTTDVEAEKGIQQLLRQEVRFVEKRAKASHIPIRSEILQSPDISQVLVRVNQSEIIFIDKSAEEDPQTFKPLSFSVADLRTKSTRQFLGIGEQDRYSDVFY